MPQVIPLRPRSAFELLDVAFSVFRQHYAKFVTLMAIGYIPYLIFVIVTSGGLTGAQSSPGWETILSGPLLMVWMMVINAAVILAASEAYHGREIVVADVLRTTVSRFGAIIVSVFLKVFMLIIGMFMFLVGAVYMYTRYFAVPASIVLEKLGPVEGMSRSAQLSKGHKWRILGVLLIAMMIMLVITMMAVIPAALTQNQIVVLLASTLLNILFQPLFGIIETLLYYDLRIRKEGYDIEVMSQSLSEPSAEQLAI